MPDSMYRSIYHGSHTCVGQATIPAEFLISFFLFGIEEVGIQIEEPFSILPLEAFCNGAIAATTEEMLGAVQSGVFEEDHEAVIPGPSY